MVDLSIVNVYQRVSQTIANSPLQTDCAHGPYRANHFRASPQLSMSSLLTNARLIDWFVVSIPMKRPLENGHLDIIIQIGWKIIKYSKPTTSNNYSNYSRYWLGNGNSRYPYGSMISDWIMAQLPPWNTPAMVLILKVGPVKPVELMAFDVPQSFRHPIPSIPWHASEKTAWICLDLFNIAIAIWENSQSLDPGLWFQLLRPLCRLSHLTSAIEPCRNGYLFLNPQDFDLKPPWNWLANSPKTDLPGDSMLFPRKITRIIAGHLNRQYCRMPADLRCHV